MAGEIFAPFPLGHVDLMKSAVRDTLRADETLHGWTDGRIFLSAFSRIRKIRDELPIAVPAILVTGISEEWTPQVGSLQKVPVPIGVTLIWEQAVDVDIEDFGISHSSAIAWISWTLAENSLLQETPGVGRRLATKMLGIEVVDAEYEVDPGADGDKPGSGLVHVDMIARYETQLDYETWQIQA